MGRRGLPCHNECGRYADPDDVDASVVIAPVGLPVVCPDCHFRDHLGTKLWTPFLVCACGDRECLLEVAKGPHCWRVVEAQVVVVDGKMFSRQCMQQVAA